MEYQCDSRETSNNQSQKDKSKMFLGKRGKPDSEQQSEIKEAKQKCT